jgi:ABC-type glycerol-3-phosphate transport system substrate-binding protein
MDRMTRRAFLIVTGTSGATLALAACAPAAPPSPTAAPKPAEAPKPTEAAKPAAAAPAAPAAAPVATTAPAPAAAAKPTEAAKPAAPAVAKTPAKLVFWNFASQYDPGLKELFLPSHPHIQMEIVNLGNPELHEKLLVSLATGVDLPDLVTIVARRANDFLSTGQFLDVTDLYKPHEDKFDSKAALITYEGKTYGFDHGGGMNGLWLNQAELSRLGVDIAKLETWDEFTDAGLKVKKDSGGKQYLHTAFFPSGAYGFNNFNVYFHARQGNWWTPDGKPEPKAEAQAADTLGWYADLKHKHDIMFEGDWRQPTYWKAAQEKAVLGFLMHYGVGTNNIPKMAPDMQGAWRFLSMPLSQKGGPALAGKWGGAFLAGLKTTKSPEAVREVMDWFLTEPGLTFMLKTWGTLHYKPALDLPEAKNTLPYFGNQNIRAEFAKRSLSPFEYWDWGKVEEALGFAVDKVWAKEWEPKQGASEMMKSLAKIAEERKG